MKRRYCIVILAVILLLGAYLRFYNIAEKGFYFDDEAIYALQAKSKIALPVAVYHHFKDGISFREAREKYMPWGFWKETNGRPGYISLVVLSFVIAGEKDSTIFILNGILSLLVIIFLYLLISLTISEEAGLIGAFLLSVSPYFLYYSRNGRSQIATSLFLLAGIYFCAKAFKKISDNMHEDRVNNSLFWGGLLIGYAFTTHWSLFVSIAVIPFCFLYLWYKKIVPFKELKKYSAGFSSGFLIPVLFFQLITVAQDALIYYFVPHTQNFANYFWEISDLLKDIPRAKVYGNLEPLFYFKLFSLMDGFILLALFLFGAGFAFYKKLYKNADFLFLLIIALASIFLISVSYTRVARTLAAFLPLVYLFIALALFKIGGLIKDRKLKFAAVAAITIFAGAGSIENNRLLLKFGNPYKKATKIAQNYASNDKIFLANYSSAPIFYFYANKILKGAETLEEAKKQGGKIFLSDWLLWEDVATNRKYFKNLRPSVSIYDPFLEMAINPLEVDRWVSYYGSDVEDFFELKNKSYFNAVNIYVPDDLPRKPR